VKILLLLPIGCQLGDPVISHRDIIPEPSVTRNAMFKVIRSSTEIAITPPQIARLRSNMVQGFITSQAIRCKCSRLKVNMSQRKVMYQQQKRYNTAMDRFSDFKLGMAS